MKSTYPIQIVFIFWRFGGNLLSTLGAPLHKFKNTQFRKQNPKQTHPEPYGIHVPNSNWISQLTFRGKFAKCPAPPIQKCKEAIYMQNPQTHLHETYEIHVLYSDCFCFIFRGKFAKYPGRPPPARMQKINFISKIPRKPPKPYEIHVPNPFFLFFYFLGAYSLEAYSLQLPILGQACHSLDWGPTVSYSLGAYTLGAYSLRLPILGQACHSPVL